MAHAPQDFVGTMDARVDLRAADDQMLDSQFVRLEWVPKQDEPRVASLPEAPPPPAEVVVHKLAADEIAGLLKRGQDFLRTGDIASARLLLRRAANGGSAEAALALGGTFDAAVLARLGVVGFARDADQARVWYGKAAEQGSAEAEKRLQSLGSAAK
jgi:TPR repeat protein